MASWIQVYSLQGENLADIWPEQGDTITIRRGGARIMTQPMLEAPVVWLDPT